MASIPIDPRPPINQGIDTNHPTVKYHDKTYNAMLESITKDSVAFTLNPYGTAPLTGYIGVWVNSVAAHLTIRITNDIGAIPVSYAVDPGAPLGPKLIPVVGLVPGAMNHISMVGLAHDREDHFNVLVPPLPLTDSELPLPPAPDDPTVFQEPPRYTGFPECEVTIPMAEPQSRLDELYFIAFNRRYIAGFDSQGMVRWYSSLDIPSLTFERIYYENGFVAASDDFDDYKQLYFFDIVGRVKRVYNLDNRSHHSIFQLQDSNTGSLLLNSENTGETVEDGLSIINLTTGLEEAYYDMRNVMDTNRKPIPNTANPIDWLHINQAYLNKTNNLIVVSARHQGVFAVKADTSELVFILANHEDWGENFQQYLLTPVDEAGKPLYDLTNPLDIDKADKEFWCWGQHACIEVPNENPGIVEFFVLDNGNWRSRHEDKALLPIDNGSCMVHYRVDCNQMTVAKIFEYGKTEVGNRGYSSYVSNAFQASNGNYVINFGGAIFDENGRPLTQGAGHGDIVDPLAGSKAQGRIILQEIDPRTKTPVFEMTFTSGLFKTEENAGPLYTVDLFSYRARKLPLLKYK